MSGDLLLQKRAGSTSKLRGQEKRPFCSQTILFQILAPPLARSLIWAPSLTPKEPPLIYREDGTF